MVVGDAFGDGIRINDTQTIDIQPPVGETWEVTGLYAAFAGNGGSPTDQIDFYIFDGSTQLFLQSEVGLGGGGLVGSVVSDDTAERAGGIHSFTTANDLYFRIENNSGSQRGIVYNGLKIQ